MTNEEFAKILSEQSNCQTCRAKLFRRRNWKYLWKINKWECMKEVKGND